MKKVFQFNTNFIYMMFERQTFIEGYTKKFNMGDSIYFLIEKTNGGWYIDTFPG